MIKVSQEVEILEENDVEVPIGTSEHIGVESHWNHDDWVILIVGSKHCRITVNADDLVCAIGNATNVNRF